jgi:hypothetical protein
MSTVCPAAVNSLTPAGVVATRDSPLFNSVGTPMIMGTSVCIVAFAEVEAVPGKGSAGGASRW